jgi:UDP-glucuronate 4-epimerase
MADHVADKLVRKMSEAGISVVGANILIMGVTFKENCPDTRNSQVFRVIAQLKKMNAKVDATDPWVDVDEAADLGLVNATEIGKYGANTNIPFSSKRGVDHPLSMYAATKKANEMMAHSYSHLFQLPTTGLRFFTVYGPWGRPDMALFLFTKAILAGEPINVFNYGKHQRDFTYIDDIVEGVIRIADSIAQPNPDWDSNNPEPDSSKAPYRIYNIGNNKKVQLLDYIETLEKQLGKKAIRNELPLQPGDVPNTWADCSELVEDFDYKPATTVDVGIAKFVKWYQNYYGASQH